MTYKSARDFTLQLIDQYSVAGVPVAETYNNQADYVKKIPRLLDDAATLAAMTVHKLRATAQLRALEHRRQGEFEIYTLPENCWRVCGAGVLRERGGVLQRYHRYRTVGKDGLAIPAEADMEGALVEYYRYPVLLGESPQEEAVLDNTPEVHLALPYYAAAHLVMLDNSFAYAALMNEFESKLAVGADAPRAEWDEREDAYGLDG